MMGEYSPVTHALAVIKIGDRYLLGYNKYRKVWEVFGGCLENNETLRECIQRECKEEIGIEITNFKCIGLMKFYLVSDYFSDVDRIEYGALYSVQLPEKETLNIIDTEEIGDICLYSKGDDIGEISIIDEKLLDYWECPD